jgi:hypothetical protein
LTRALYGHMVAATLVDCLLVIAALAVRSMAPWVAGVLMVSALALAAHAAHVRRHGPRSPVGHQSSEDRSSDCGAGGGR